MTEDLVALRQKMSRRLLGGMIPICAAAGLLCSPAIAQELEPVEVKLNEWDLGFKEVTVEEKARFEIENIGAVEHAFEVEGESGGQKVEIKSPTLKPGEKTVLEVELPAGTYEAYCPLHDHRDKGMAGAVTVAGGLAARLFQSQRGHTPLPTRPVTVSATQSATRFAVQVNGILVNFGTLGDELPLLAPRPQRYPLDADRPFPNPSIR
jgi:plastocyanin